MTRPLTGFEVTAAFDREHTTCGHPVPEWHETTWGTGGNVFCSAECMGKFIDDTKGEKTSSLSTCGSCGLSIPGDDALCWHCGSPQVHQGSLTYTASQITVTSVDNYRDIEEKIGRTEEFKGNSMSAKWDGDLYTVKSYSTPIAHYHKGKNQKWVSENHWGQTSGRHINLAKNHLPGEIVGHESELTGPWSSARPEASIKPRSRFVPNVTNAVLAGLVEKTAASYPCNSCGKSVNDPKSGPKISDPSTVKCEDCIKRQHGYYPYNKTAASQEMGDRFGSLQTSPTAGRVSGMTTIAEYVESAPGSDEDLWENFSGASWETWPWWSSVSFNDAAKTCTAEADDPDNEEEGQGGATKTFGLAEIKKAMRFAQQKGYHYTGISSGPGSLEFPTISEGQGEYYDIDADYGDVIAQICVLGDVVYG